MFFMLMIFFVAFQPVQADFLETLVLFNARILPLVCFVVTPVTVANQNVIQRLVVKSMVMYLIYIFTSKFTYL